MSAARAKKKSRVGHSITCILVALVTLFGLSACAGTTGAKPTSGDPTISTPAIQTAGTLVVGVDSTRAPYAGMSKGNLVGIDVDVAAALADQLGLKLELVDTAGQSADQLLRDGEVDMVMDVEQSGVSITQGKEIGPYILSGPALFTTVKGDTVPTIDIKSLSGAKIIAQKDSLSAWAVSEVIGDQAVVPADTLADALSAVSDGTQTYAAADAVLGSYIATSQEDVACVRMLSDKPIGVYIGVEGSNTQLADAITTALRTIRDSGELKIILSKWLGPISAEICSSADAIVSQNSTGSTPPSDSGEVDTGEDLPDPANAGGTSTAGNTATGAAGTS